MKKLLYWLIAIGLAFLMVWGVRNYFIKRVFYQPDWYEEQKQTGETLQSPEWGQPDATPPPAVSVVPESQLRGAPSRSIPETASHPESANRTPGTVSSGSHPRDAAVGTLEARRETRLERALREEGRVRIAAGDLVPLLLDEMRGQDDFDPYSVVRGAKSTITPGSVIVEMILDVEKIPPERLTPEGVRVLDEIRKLVPEKYLHEVYVKANLLPRVNGDQIEFAGNSTISIGRISLPFSELEKRLDIQPRMDMDAFNFRDLRIENGYIELYK